MIGAIADLNQRKTPTSSRGKTTAATIKRDGYNVRKDFEIMKKAEKLELARERYNDWILQYPTTILCHFESKESVYALEYACEACLKNDFVLIEYRFDTFRTLGTFTDEINAKSAYRAVERIVCGECESLFW